MSKKSYNFFIVYLTFIILYVIVTEFMNVRATGEEVDSIGIVISFLFFLLPYFAALIILKKMLRKRCTQKMVATITALTVTIQDTGRNGGGNSELVGTYVLPSGESQEILFIQATKNLRHLAVGEKIVVMVNPKKPTEYYIHDIPIKYRKDDQVTTPNES